MICTAEGDAQKFVVTLHAQPDVSDGLALIWPIIPLVILVTIVHVTMVIFGAVVAYFFFTALTLQRMWGITVLAIEPDSLVLSRKTFGVGTTKNFPRQEVESIFFVPEFSTYEVGRVSASLGLMAQSLMTPCTIGKGISKPEAEQVLEDIKKSGTWLAERIRSR